MAPRRNSGAGRGPRGVQRPRNPPPAAALSGVSAESVARRSAQAPRGVRQHRIDAAIVGEEVFARMRAVAVVAADLGEQALEFLDVFRHRLAELRVGLVAAADLVERLLALRRIEPAREGAGVALAPAVPHFGGRRWIDQRSDVERNSIELLDARPAFGAGRGGGLALLARGAR